MFYKHSSKCYDAYPICIIPLCKQMSRPRANYRKINFNLGHSVRFRDAEVAKATRNVTT